MDIIKNLEINVFSMVILGILYVKLYTKSKQLFSDRIFKYMLLSGLFLIAASTATWIVNGRDGSIFYLLNWATNILQLMFTPLPALLWIVYADYEIFRSRKQAKRKGFRFAAIVLIDAVLVLTTPLNGLIMTVDADNIYSRGPWFLFHVMFNFFLILYVTMLILKNQSRIETRNFWTLLLYPVPTIIGAILHTSFYGVSVTWPSYVIAVLILYCNLLDVGIKTDYLTGLFNRRVIDSYVAEKIAASTKKKSFSAIAIDLDEFKQINDRFGHDEGDAALIWVAQLLKRSIGTESMIARYGGDEFYVVLNTDSRKELTAIMEKIVFNLKAHNREKTKPYEIHLSMGADVYDAASGYDAERFMKHLDGLMYRQKEEHHQMARIHADFCI